MRKQLLVFGLGFALAIGVPGIATAVTITVPGQHATIQAAIDAAIPGDTIQVAAGNYAEADINVDKSVSIVGPNDGSVWPDHLGTVVTWYFNRAPDASVSGKFTLNADDISIRGMDIRGSDKGVVAGRSGLSGIDISHNVIEALRGASGAAHAISCDYGGDATVSGTNWSITDNYVSGMFTNDSTMIYLTKIDGLTIEHNFLSSNYNPASGRYGVNLDGCWNALVKGNYIETGGLGSPLTESTYAIALGSTDRITQDVTIEGNRLRYTPYGIVTGSRNDVDDIVIQGNAIDFSKYGVALNQVLPAATRAGVRQGDISIVNNRFFTNDKGVTLSNQRSSAANSVEFYNIDVNQNWFTSSCGFYVDDKWGAPLMNIVEGAANVENNWWNSTASPASWGVGNSTAYGANDPESPAVILGYKADVDPWLTWWSDDPAKAGAFGFWPDAHSMRVPPSSDAPPVVLGSGVVVDFGTVTGSGGAMDGGVRVVATSTPVAEPAGYSAAGAAYEIDPVNSMNFTFPVKITLPYDRTLVQGADTPTILGWNGTAWAELENVTYDSNAGTVSGDTNHFSTFEPASEEGPVSPGVTSTPASSLWSLALLGLAATAMTTMYMSRDKILGRS